MREVLNLKHGDEWYEDFSGPSSWAHPNFDGRLDGIAKTLALMESSRRQGSRTMHMRHKDENGNAAEKARSLFEERVARTGMWSGGAPNKEYNPRIMPDFEFGAHPNSAQNLDEFGREFTPEESEGFQWRVDSAVGGRISREVGREGRPFRGGTALRSLVFRPGDIFSRFSSDARNAAGEPVYDWVMRALHQRGHQLTTWPGKFVTDETVEKAAAHYTERGLDISALLEKINNSQGVISDPNHPLLQAAFLPGKGTWKLMPRDIQIMSKGAGRFGVIDLGLKRGDIFIFDVTDAIHSNTWYPFQRGVCGERQGRCRRDSSRKHGLPIEGLGKLLWETNRVTDEGEIQDQRELDNAKIGFAPSGHSRDVHKPVELRSGLASAGNAIKLAVLQVLVVDHTDNSAAFYKSLRPFSFE
jgi:hypothetical protein